MEHNDFKVDKTLLSKLTRIYFANGYYGFMSKITPEEKEFITNNTFKVIVTDKTKNNGYNSDMEKVKEHLELYVPYTLVSMNVDRSSGTLTLVEFPDIEFNTVNFEYLEVGS